MLPRLTGLSPAQREANVATGGDYTGSHWGHRRGAHVKPLVPHGGGRGGGRAESHRARRIASDLSSAQRSPAQRKTIKATQGGTHGKLLRPHEGNKREAITLQEEARSRGRGHHHRGELSCPNAQLGPGQPSSIGSYCEHYGKHGKPLWLQNGKHGKTSGAQEKARGRWDRNRGTMLPRCTGGSWAKKAWPTAASRDC